MSDAGNRHSSHDPQRTPAGPPDDMEQQAAPVGQNGETEQPFDDIDTQITICWGYTELVSELDYQYHSHGN